MSHRMMVEILERIAVALEKIAKIKLGGDECPACEMHADYGGRRIKAASG